MPSNVFDGKSETTISTFASAETKGDYSFETVPRFTITEDNSATAGDDVLPSVRDASPMREYPPLDSGCNSRNEKSPRLLPGSK